MSRQPYEKKLARLDHLYRQNKSGPRRQRRRMPTQPTIFIDGYQLRIFGPKRVDHPSVLTGMKCPGCQQPFQESDYTTLIPIGPGDDEEAQRNARWGHVYNAVSVEAHLTCVTGYKYEDLV